ncbi:MAG: hypothetical protein ACKVPY_06425 [Paracoccaceae bacterium]
MKQVALALALILAPVILFAGGYGWLAPPAAAAAAAGNGLGDLPAMTAIVADVQALSAKGDTTAAATRITDFETAWDDAAPSLRRLDPAAWGNADAAADAALKAARADAPDPARVTATLTALQSALTAPASGEVANGRATEVAGIAVTDAAGHNLPCEEMLRSIDAALSAAGPAPEASAKVAALKSQALERCNADDDANANGFSARALALLGNS